MDLLHLLARLGQHIPGVALAQGLGTANHIFEGQGPGQMPLGGQMQGNGQLQGTGPPQMRPQYMGGDGQMSIYGSNIQPLQQPAYHNTYVGRGQPHFPQQLIGPINNFGRGNAAQHLQGSQTVDEVGIPLQHPNVGLQVNNRRNNQQIRI